MVYCGSTIWMPTDIQHHGVLGQKWGVRRYQNADGTLTDAGRRRYGADLDVNNKSRKNIAKIRLGEARRRYDTAKENNPTNKTRLAELKGRERSAKKAVREARVYDRGAKLAAKGQTITGNKVKQYITNGAIFAGSKIMAATLSAAASSTGKYKALDTINTVGQYTLGALMIGSSAKTYMDNAALRSYYNSSFSGRGSIKNVGSEEYRDVVERRKKGG